MCCDVYASVWKSFSAHLRDIWWDLLCHTLGKAADEQEFDGIDGKWETQHRDGDPPHVVWNN